MPGSSWSTLHGLSANFLKKYFLESVKCSYWSLIDSSEYRLLTVDKALKIQKKLQKVKKKYKFEGVWANLQSEVNFLRQSVKKYLVQVYEIKLNRTFQFFAVLQILICGR